jgi:hypothetical protein
VRLNPHGQLFSGDVASGEVEHQSLLFVDGRDDP